MAFSLKYYNPATGDDKFRHSDNEPSGQYVFKPKQGDMDKKPYSDFVKIETYKGTNTGTQCFVLHYSDSDKERMYTALIRLVPGADLDKVIEWDVLLHGIPIEDDGLGKEVVVNWELLEFDNESTFYTDANGLEMQKRVLNYRPDFTLETDEVVSANYYPVNSAIAIRSPSTGVQFTVMNDRSQGGSSLADGSIELMQNRRLLFFDSGSVHEPLNQTNASGEGIQVNNRYHLQLFNYQEAGESMQRKIQLITDEPLMYFSAKAGKGPERLIEPAIKSGAKVPDFDGNLKVQLLPQGRLSILIRLQNLADLFDGAPAETPMFDLLTYARELFTQANPSLSAESDFSVQIKERTLSDTMDYADWQREKIQWKTVAGTDNSVEYPADAKQDAVVALQP